MAEEKHTSVGTYILIALILAVITYVEFAIVEYDIAWLSGPVILWSLIIMSVVKFLLVILYFMHLKGDDAMYQGFFASGMLFALGTFAVLAFLFTFPSTFSFLRGGFTPPVVSEHAEEQAGLNEATRTLIESQGYSRDLATQLDTPAPRSQGFHIEAPEAPPAEFAMQPGDASAAEGDGADAAEETAEDAETEAAGDGAPSWDQALGEETYASNCASCHQGNGQGVPGAFPPLAGHVGEIAQVEGGRTYLVDVLLNGLQGPIEVDGQSYDGVMPAWGQLGDDAIAAVLNHALFDFEGSASEDEIDPIAPDEVAQRRDTDLGPQDVHDTRQELDLP